MGARTRPPTPRRIWSLSNRKLFASCGYSRRGAVQTAHCGTTRVRVRFITSTGDEIEQAAHLFDYPLWTVISNPDGRAISHITIDTLDYVLAGPALNEVKAFRTQSGGG